MWLVDVEPLFAMTLAPSKESKFTRDDALWVIQRLARGYRVWYTVSETCATDIRNSGTPRDYQYHRKISHRSTPYLSRMRIIGSIFLDIHRDFLGTGSEVVFRWINTEMALQMLDSVREISHLSQIPGVVVAITNNLLSFVGYISLGVILIGALMYVFGGVSEEMKSK
jgi:hypothetical protein